MFLACGKLGTFPMQTLQFFSCLFMKLGHRFLTTYLLDVKDILKQICRKFPKLQSVIFKLECLHLLVAPKCVLHAVRAQNGGFLVGKDVFSSSLCAALYEMCTEDPSFGGEASEV